MLPYSCTKRFQSNWNKVAKELGYKDAGIAKTRWTQVRKKKIDVGQGSPSGGVDKATTNKVSPTKAKKAKAKDKKSKDVKLEQAEESAGEDIFGMKKEESDDSV